MRSVYRVQDAEGRGPWRPGFSHVWVRDRPDHSKLRPWIEQFGMKIISNADRQHGRHFGCACRTMEQLRRWFVPEEYFILLRFGYQAVQLDATSVLAENDIQLVFQRARALRHGAVPLALYGIGDQLRT